MNGRKALVLLASAAALVALFVVLRPGGDDDEQAEAGPVATATTSPAETTTAAETTAATTTRGPVTTHRTAPDPVVRALIVVQGDGPTRPRKLKVAQGRRVVLTIRADVADEVHVHGYDVVRRVAPGSPARLAFEADIAGVFEIELEERHVLIAELEVRP